MTRPRMHPKAESWGSKGGTSRTRLQPGDTVYGVPGEEWRSGSPLAGEVESRKLRSVARLVLHFDNAECPTDQPSNTSTPKCERNDQGHKPPRRPDPDGPANPMKFHASCRDL